MVRPVVTATLALAAIARASGALAWSYGGYVSVDPLCPVDPTPLRVEREEADVDCSASDATHLRCAARVLRVVRNPTGAPQQATLRVPPRAEGRGEVTVTTDDGAAVRREREGERLTITVAPGATREVVMRAVWSASLRREHASMPWERGALGLLHPLLADELDDAVRVSISLARAQGCNVRGVPSWGGVGVTTMATRAPVGWRPTTGWEQRGLYHEGDAGLACAQVESVESATTVTMSIERAGPSLPLRSGGVLVALGVTSGQGFRARGGYEVGLGRRFAGALTVEGDASGNLILGATVGLTKEPFGRWYWRDWALPGAIIPWLGAVVGALPQARVGARAQVTVAWPFAGVDLGVDWWPVEGRAEVTFMVRSGL